jgi:hypothetical protein
VKVRGELTLHGVTQPVEFEARFNQLKRHPLNFRRTAGFSATLELSRKAFGMGAWPGVIDDRVELLVELEATKAKSTPPQPSPAPSVQGMESSRASGPASSNAPQAEGEPAPVEPASGEQSDATTPDAEPKPTERDDAGA